MLLFFLLEQKWSYISYRNLLPGAQGDLRKISLASMLADCWQGFLGGGPWQSLLKGLLDSWPVPLGLVSLFWGLG